MIGEYKINRTTRRCHVSNRPLEPGETYYSVVTEHDEDFKRIDIAADAWTGPPENCVGYWKNRVPRPEEKKRELAPPEVLIEILRSMTEPYQAKMRYLLALMLMRKRHLRPVESAALIRSESDANERAPSPNDVAQESAEADTSEQMELESNLDGSTVSVVVCDIAASEAESLQAQLVDLLYREVE
ncbi:hypothetical protein [Neorhodopirellula pilleata]|uniref:Uncharacterized protein n=1 Tax=Neorhodopirellula pilleata TaxID=2714738 RepID=A0A5C6AVA5_9BACT|nr:hypothetical protein [Neorhodopirellula pilleata]TWU03955.1 hypothetical protein Pla100_08910 [Neorhodopirellula pilleata]